MSEIIFDNIIELPSLEIKSRSENLIGFEKRYERIYSNLKLLIDPEGLGEWSKKFHSETLPIINSLNQRYPLIIMEGDAGTGKTASAECFADRMVRELKKEGFFIKLSTRVRGEGVHGEMGNLVNDAFDKLKKEAGKKRLAFLFIDEADAIATTRSTLQMHQEEKAAVNTLIQKIDDIRSVGGRAIVFMATNRLKFLDEAIIRRAALIMTFERPDAEERKALFKFDLKGVKLSSLEIDELVFLTGDESNNGLGYSYSDIRLRVLPEAIAMVFPNKPLTMKVLKETIAIVKPSPQIK